MTHPEELLAGYVDGTLAGKDRAAVDAHLGVCRTCREELALASQAVITLAALPEEPVPVGVTAPVMAEVGRRTSKPARMPWRERLQWAAGLATAAALVTIVAINLSGAGGGNAPTSAGKTEGSPVTDAGAAKQFAQGLVPVEHQGVDYDETKVVQLASSVAQGPTMRAPVPPPPGAGIDEATTALRCISQYTGLSENDTVVQLIDASFHGTPAYLGVFLESPGAGQPPAKVVIWTVAKSDCSILSITTKLLKP